MSVIASPIQQGPAPPNTQTRIHNNTLKVASVGGGQNAVYHVVGGAINNNVNLNLPALAADDTVATLGQNNNWTGTHSFANGFSAQGPITTTSINANGPITTNDAIKATGNISGSNITASGNLIANGNLTANGNLVVNGNFTPNNLSTPGTLSVGTTATLTGAVSTGALTVNGNHTVTGSSTVAAVTASGLHFVSSSGGITNKGGLTALNPAATAYVAGVGHLMLRNDTGGTDHDFFGITAGGSKGLVILTGNTQAIGFYNATPQQQQIGGNLVAANTYGSNESLMLNRLWGMVRNTGLVSP